MRFKIFILGFIALFYVLTAQGQDTDCFLYDMNVSIPLYGSYEDQYGYGTILGFSKETSWLKLSIPTQNGYVYGWTLNYCGCILGSCEGDRAHPPSRVYGEINR